MLKDPEVFVIVMIGESITKFELLDLYANELCPLRETTHDSIDEVESLTAARSGMQGAEPTDAVRVSCLILARTHARF